MVQEKELKPLAGGMMVALLLILIPAATIYGFIWSVREGIPAGILVASLTFVVDIVLLGGFTVVNPNESKVVLLFGVYLGSIKQPGFWWVNPFTRRRRVSLRVRNFESSKLKVNDQDGNPIEIASVIVWRVIETAEAVFHVDDYQNFVKVQTEAAVRNLATSYTYDAHLEGDMSLRGNTAEVAEHMKKEIQERLATAGVEVIEARISHLAYAPEIAQAMLQRQQAGAIIAARQRIVEGAVGMVEMALDLLAKREILEFDNERKAAMVSNLLVVLCGERATQPVINAGTIYQ